MLRIFLQPYNYINILKTHHNLIFLELKFAPIHYYLLTTYSRIQLSIVVPTIFYPIFVLGKTKLLRPFKTNENSSLWYVFDLAIQGAPDLSEFLKIIDKDNPKTQLPFMRGRRSSSPDLWSFADPFEFHEQETFTGNGIGPLFLDGRAASSRPMRVGPFQGIAPTDLPSAT